MALTAAAIHVNGSAVRMCWAPEIFKYPNVHNVQELIGSVVPCT